MTTAPKEFELTSSEQPSQKKVYPPSPYVMKEMPPLPSVRTSIKRFFIMALIIVCGYRMLFAESFVPRAFIQKASDFQIVQKYFQPLSQFISRVFRLFKTKEKSEKQVCFGPRWFRTCWICLLKKKLVYFWDSVLCFCGLFHCFAYFV